MAKPTNFTPQDKNQFPALLGASGTAQDGSAQAKPITFTESGSKRLLDVASDNVETTGFNGGTVSVGTTAVEVTFTGVTQAFMIQADHDNGTMIYIGGSDVTQVGANSVARLEPGDALTLELNDASAPVYAVGGTTAQKIYKLALT